MGIIRGGLVFFAGILLLFSLIIGNIFLTMSLSIGYENVKSGLADAVKKEIGINLNQDLSTMQNHCQNSLEYSFNPNIYDLGSVSLPCSVVIQGQEQVLNFAVEKYAEKKYYQNYSCGLIDCPLETLSPMVYTSQHAKNYYSKIFYYSLIASLILIALMFLFIENKKKIFYNAGILLVISSLPLLVLNWSASLFSSINLLNFTGILFSESSVVFWIIFIFGLILISVGIGLHFWKFNSKEKKEDSAEIEKEEFGEKAEFVKKKKLAKGKNKY